MNDEPSNNITYSINTYWANFIELSGTASSIARQLAFVEGAIFWILYNGSSSMAAKILLCIFLFALVLYFILDVLQYLYAAFKYEQLASTLTNVRSQNPRYTNICYSNPDAFIKAPSTLYVLKYIFLLISFILLIVMFVIFITDNNGLRPTIDTKNSQMAGQLKSKSISTLPIKK